MTAPAAEKRCHQHFGNHGCSLDEGHAGHHRDRRIVWAFPVECGHTDEQHKWGGDFSDCLGLPLAPEPSTDNGPVTGPWCTGCDTPLDRCKWYRETGRGLACCPDCNGTHAIPAAVPSTASAERLSEEEFEALCSIATQQFKSSPEWMVNSAIPTLRDEARRARAAEAAWEAEFRQARIDARNASYAQHEIAAERDAARAEAFTERTRANLAEADIVTWRERCDALRAAELEKLRGKA
jgi:hypothetical protein